MSSSCRLAAMLLAFSLAAATQIRQNSFRSEKSGRCVSEVIAKASDDLGMLSFAFKAAGMDGLFMEDENDGNDNGGTRGPYTLLAPNDQAFAKLGRATLESLLEDEEDLKMILSRHVIIGQAASSEDISRGSSLFPTLGGEFVTLTKKEKDNNETVITAASSLGEATVIKADVEAENSVIHVIDSLL